MRGRVPSIILAVAAAGTLSALALAQAPTPAAPPASPVAFARDIQPILEKSCWNCHSADVQLADLDLSTREAAIRGGEHGAAIVPGSADKSRLYRMIAGLESITMPMDGSSLTPAEISAIKTWIDQGLNGMRSPNRLPSLRRLPHPTPLPRSRRWTSRRSSGITGRSSCLYRQRFRRRPRTWCNPIDRFLESERAKKGLIAAPRADRRTLIRRAYLDLIGLPPSPAQVRAFLDDKSPDAWTRVIEALLASPHYGERWGRHWLDVARYADSDGFEQDFDRPNAWRYRDYVIASLNQDKPYNQFLKEQIAGDEMDGKSNETLIATGFLRAGPRVNFREKDNPERRWDYVDDLISTVSRGTLGLTVNCARCHNHKFDPIAQKDYYSLAAALNTWVEISSAARPG